MTLYRTKYIPIYIEHRRNFLQQQKGLINVVQIRPPPSPTERVTLLGSQIANNNRFNKFMAVTG